MSHGTYLFLLDAASTTDESKPAIEDQFRFRYANNFCGENNWFEVMYLARPDKQTVSYDSGRKWVPTYEEAYLAAWGIAINDLRLIEGAPTLNITRDDSLDAAFEALKARGPRYLDLLIRHVVPKRIVKSFHPGEERTHLIRFTDLGFERFRRDSLVKGFQCYNASFVPPFAQYLCSPDDWRLFDLREEAPSDDVLQGLLDSPILGVDIHT